MLRERLKMNERCSDEREKSEEKEAEALADRTRLYSTSQRLVILMSAIERSGSMTRQEVEDYVIKCLEAHEQRVYGMDDEQFALYAAVELLQWLRRKEK